LDYTTADMFIWNENYSDDSNMNGANGLPLYADNLMRMVMNPDVTVRSRGVIEKCSFCVQRIQEGKLTSKRENRQLRDSDIKTACQTSCPTGAITFGDRNNHESDLAKKLNSDLTYVVIEETNVAPNVSYTMKVRNRTEALETSKGTEKAS
jgi:molybdopterin-containing oxidoreductase family iron-sulfur binding subunit